MDKGLNIDDKFLSFVLDGTCHLADAPHKNIQRTYNKMPLYNVNGKDLQVFVSEYSLTSFLKTIIDLKSLNYTFNVTSEQVQSVIDNFDKPFGDSQTVLMKIATTPSNESEPTVTVSHDVSKISFEIQIHVMNPFDSSVDAVVMKAKITPSVMMSVRSDYKLYMELQEDMELQFTEAKAFFKSALNKDQLNTRINFVKPILVAFINSKLMDGIALPIPAQYKSIIKNPKVLSFDHYLTVEFEPDFTQQKKQVEASRVV